MKNNMDYFKTMNEKDLDLTKTAVDWTDKAFRGNGDCAAIARTTGKTCKVVLRDGEDTSFLEGIHAFLLKNGKLDAECSWKSENGVRIYPFGTVRIPEILEKSSFPLLSGEMKRKRLSLLATPRRLNRKTVMSFCFMLGMRKLATSGLATTGMVD